MRLALVAIGRERGEFERPAIGNDIIVCIMMRRDVDDDDARLREAGSGDDNGDEYRLRSVRQPLFIRSALEVGMSQ
jgi:hypothetical protein